MSIISIKKQLKFKCLISHIQNVMKLNFVSSPKMTFFALVNRLLGLPRESAYSLYPSVWNLDTSHSIKSEWEMSFHVDCIRIPTIYTKWRNSDNLIYFYYYGSPSPTVRDRVKLMAPLSSLLSNLSGPRTNKKSNGTDKMP